MKLRNAFKCAGYKTRLCPYRKEVCDTNVKEWVRSDCNKTLMLWEAFRVCFFRLLWNFRDILFVESVFDFTHLMLGFKVFCANFRLY